MVTKTTATDEEIAELDKVGQCTRCLDWYHLKVLKSLNVGEKKKPFCLNCIRLINKNSKDQGFK